MVVIATSSNEPHEVAIAWQQLEAHKTNRQTGLCTVCHLPGPCAVANEAAAVLVERGVEVVEDPLPEERRRLRRMAILVQFRRRARRRGPGR